VETGEHQFKGGTMAGAKRSKATDIVFEGVAIPRGSRSAKLARKGITNSDEMGKFLTAIFADTLSGKITLPSPSSPNRMSSKRLIGLEHKLRHGIPLTIQPMGLRVKRKPKPGTIGPKGQARSG
jgi:hypothetical protein